MNNLSYFLFLMIVGTFCYGLNDVIKKKVLNILHPVFLLGIVWTGAGLVLLLLSIILDVAGPKTGFWQAFAVTFSAGLISQILVWSSFAKEEASLMSPLRLITPPIVLVTGFFFLGEKPSLFGIIGVLITFIGLWWLLSGQARFRQIPFKDMLKNRGVLFGMIGSIIVGFSFPFDKKAVVFSSSLFYSWVLLLSIGLVTLFWAYFKHRKQLALLSKENYITTFWLIILNVLGGWFTFEALKFSSAAYAANMKRLWPLWAVLLSGKLLKEENIAKKVFAVLIMLAGIALTLFRG